MNILEHLILLALTLWCGWLGLELVHLKSLWRTQECWLDRLESLEHQDRQKQTKEILDSLK